MLIQLLTNEDLTEGQMDMIGEFGSSWNTSTETDFVERFRALRDDARLVINLNSPGGAVFQALAVRNLLAQHKGSIICNVLGWAASAATFITSLPNVHTVMYQGSFLMIHNPWNMAVGDQHDLRKEADTLERIAHEMARFYADKSGMDLSEVQRLMDAETWFTAEEAVEKGLADELCSFAKVAASATVDGHPVLGGVALTSGSLPQSLLNEEKRMANKQQAAAENEAAAKVEKVEQPAAAITTAEQLQAAYPELVKALQTQAVDSALKAERVRMQQLDAIRSRAPTIVDKAKYETLADAAQTALEILKADAQQAEQKAKAVEQDAQEVAATVAQLDQASTPDAAVKSSGDLNSQINAWVSLAETVAKTEKRF